MYFVVIERQIHTRHCYGYFLVPHFMLQFSLKNFVMFTELFFTKILFLREGEGKVVDRA